MQLPSLILSLLVLSRVAFAAPVSSGIHLTSVESAADWVFDEFQKAHFDLGALAELADKFEKQTTEGHLTLSPQERSQYLATTNSVIANEQMTQRLALLITSDAKSDIEKVLRIHNFVAWRLTHVAGFPPPKPGQKEFRTKKERIYQCVEANVNGNSPPEVMKSLKEGLSKCGISFDFDISFETSMRLNFLWGVGNCYQYATMFAALTRAAGIATHFYSATQLNGAHYWVQVFVKGQWLIVDPTYDDYFDVGQYGENSMMKIDFTYFLITPEMAASLDSIHRHFVSGDDERFTPAFEKYNNFGYEDER